MLKKLSNIGLLLCVAALSTNSTAAGWDYGVSIGLGALEIDGVVGFDGRGPGGDVGIDTQNVQVGPLDMDLDSDDISDMVDSAFGFGGFAKNDKWTILYAVSSMELEDVNDNDNLEVTWEKSSFELSFVYEFAKTKRNRFGILFGAVYTDQEFEIEVTGAGIPEQQPTSLSVSADDSWTDIIFGFTHSFAFAKNLSWNTRIDGGSEGRFYADTGLTWKFADSWATRLSVSQLEYDYEEKDPGEENWFLYDADETRASLSISFLF